MRKLTLDIKTVGEKSAFKRAKKIESFYGARLRRIAKHIADIVGTLDPDTPESVFYIQQALERYAASLDPYANAVAKRMITEVAARDAQAWRKASAEIGRGIRNEIASAPTGQLVRDLVKIQVDLIKSLPLEAAKRVADLTREGIANGTRAKEIAAQIMETGEVSKSRATMIARTEIGRTATAFTQARAEHVGSTHFIWRTAGDADVRPSHKRLNGQSFRWDAPPECDPGHHALPGSIWNCRCYAEPLLPEDDE